MKEIVKYLVKKKNKKVVQVASEAWCRRKVRTQKVSRMKRGSSLSLVSCVRNDLYFSTQQNRKCSVETPNYLQSPAEMRITGRGVVTSLVWCVCVFVFKAIL